MQALRRARFLARLVLVWFALSLGAAIASPLIEHADIEVICSGSAIKLLVKGDTNGGKPTGHTLECPLCGSIAAPPPVICTDLAFVPVLGHAVQPIPAARIAALTTAPLPARGPPAFPIV